MTNAAGATRTWLAGPFALHPATTPGTATTTGATLTVGSTGGITMVSVMDGAAGHFVDCG